MKTGTFKNRIHKTNNSTKTKTLCLKPKTKITKKTVKDNKVFCNKIKCHLLKTTKEPYEVN